jgi:hypothetical protein
MVFSFAATYLLSNGLPWYKYGDLKVPRGHPGSRKTPKSARLDPELVSVLSFVPASRTQSLM